jgi:GNAT superfamily N-acetyltransferase
MQIEIRGFQDSDYEAYVELHNRVYPEYPTAVEEARRWDGLRDPAHYFRRLVAREPETGRMLGAGTLSHNWFAFNPKLLRLEIIVLPEYQRQGIGTELYQQFEGLTRAAGVPRLRIPVSESRASGLAFVGKLGFTEHHRVFESKLNVKNFDFSKFEDAAPQLCAQGIVLTTLGDEVQGAKFERAYHKIKKVFVLQNECGQDIPSPDPVTPLTLERFFALAVEPPTADLKSLQLAKHGDRYVGLSHLIISETDPVLYQALTAVHRDYRRRGIALALKLQGIRYARTKGFQSIRTNNDTVNTGMLAINRMLGFVSEPSWIAFEKAI